MGKSRNKVSLLGNVGADPEVRTSGAGNKYAKFSIAENKSVSDGHGGRREVTQWHRCTVLDAKLAEIVEAHVKVGTRLLIDGRIEYSESDSPNCNCKRHWTDIIVHELTLL